MNTLANYQDIAADIRSKINHGFYQKEHKLPKQSELASHYQTSRVTIQKALTMLQMEGIIYAKKGIGTFISNSYSTFDYNAKINRGLTKRLGETGKITSKIISFDVIYPDEKEQEKLKITADQQIYDIVRLRLFDDIPVVLEYTIMPLHIIPGITTSVLSSSVYGYITNHLHQTIGTSIRRIKADHADTYDQQYLACAATDPILEVEQTVYLGNGIPFEFSQSRHRYDMGDFIVINT